MFASYIQPIPRPKWPNGFAQKIYDRQSGRCYHCHKDNLGPRDPEKGQHRLYDLDHYPISYKDLSDNLLPRIKILTLCVIVTDPLDPENIVASCQNCNRSHLFEGTRTQCHLPRRLIIINFTIFLSFVAGLTVGIFV
jgi:hypothetical protein